MYEKSVKKIWSSNDVSVISNIGLKFSISNIGLDNGSNYRKKFISLSAYVNIIINAPDYFVSVTRYYNNKN